MVKKLNSSQLLKNVSREKISLTNQRSKFFHIIKTKFSRITAGKKNMAAKNVINDTEKTRYNNLSTLAILKLVEDAKKKWKNLCDSYKKCPDRERDLCKSGSGSGKMPTSQWAR